MKKIRLLHTVKKDGEWFEPGSVLEFPAKDANELILGGHAEMHEDTPIPSIGDESDLTQFEQESILEKLGEIEGVNDDLALRLFHAGFETVQQVAEADAEDLVMIKGIGARSVEKIQDSAGDIFDDMVDDL